MIYIKDIEQIARILSDTQYKGIKILASSIEIPYEEWDEFEQGLFRYYAPKDIKIIKEIFSMELGNIRRHIRVKMGQFTINCFRERPFEKEPRIKGDWRI